MFSGSPEEMGTDQDDIALAHEADRLADVDPAVATRGSGSADQALVGPALDRRLAHADSGGELLGGKQLFHVVTICILQGRAPVGSPRQSKDRGAK